MNDELTEFVVPPGSYKYLRLIDTPESLRAAPGSIFWFAPIALLIPWTAVAWKTWQSGGPQWCEAFGLPWYHFFVFALFGTSGPLVAAYLFDRQSRAEGDWFLLDKSLRTLSLPRSQKVLKAAAIERIIEIKGWWKGVEQTVWAYEISVLARTDDGSVTRLPVAQADWRTGPRIAKELASTLGASRTVVEYPMLGSAVPRITDLDSAAEH